MGYDDSDKLAPACIYAYELKHFSLIFIMEEDGSVEDAEQEVDHQKSHNVVPKELENAAFPFFHQIEDASKRFRRVLVPRMGFKEVETINCHKSLVPVDINILAFVEGLCCQKVLLRNIF